MKNFLNTIRDAFVMLGCLVIGLIGGLICVVALVLNIVAIALITPTGWVIDWAYGVVKDIFPDENEEKSEVHIPAE